MNIMLGKRLEDIANKKYKFCAGMWCSVKNNLSKIGKSLLFCLLLFSSYVHAAVLTDKQRDIINKVFEKGFINKKLHDEYWKEFKVKPTKKEQEQVRKQTSLLEDYSIIVYTAAKESIITKKPQYEMAKAALDFYKQNGIKNSYEQTISLLEHAANGIAMPVYGKLTYITLDSIEIAKENIRSRQDRINMLLEEEWNPTPKEVSINENVSVLWPYNFFKKESDQDQSYIGDTALYFSQMDEHTMVFITASFSDINQSDRNRVSTCIKNVVTNSGRDDIEPSFEHLNNDIMATASYKLESSEHNMFLNIACVVHRDQLVFIGAKSDKYLDSSTQFSELKRNIKIK